MAGGAHMLRRAFVFLKGPWGGHRDGALHSTGDATGGLQLQELLHRDGVQPPGELSRNGALSSSAAFTVSS